jgi:hypothetical protein
MFGGGELVEELQAAHAAPIIPIAKLRRNHDIATPQWLEGFPVWCEERYRWIIRRRSPAVSPMARALASRERRLVDVDSAEKLRFGTGAFRAPRFRTPTRRLARIIHDRAPSPQPAHGRSGKKRRGSVSKVA